MAVEDLSRILRVPSRLVLSPTSFALAFPYGGKQLGAVKDIVVRPNQERRALTAAEEYGGEVVEVIGLGESWTISAALRGWDDDALNAVFVNTSVGASSGRRLVDYPGASQAGLTKGATQATGLLVAADDPLRMPCVYFPKAVVLVEESAELTLQLAEEATVAIVAYALRRASDGRVAQWGLLEDLSV